LVRELDELLKNYYLNKVYQVGPATLLLKFNMPGKPGRQLLAEAGRRVHLTRYVVEKPPRPPPFCQALRKHLLNARVKGVWQPNLERIIIFDFHSAKGEYKLAVELFAKGNILLLDGKGKILHALSTGKIGGRSLAKGETYVQPPSGATTIPTLESFMEFLKGFKGEVVKALTRSLGIGGIYAEEFLLRAGVEKSKDSREITPEEAERILGAASAFFSLLEKPQPCLYLDEEGRPVAVAPTPLERFKGLRFERFESLNEAVDEFYVRLEAERVKAEREKEIELQLEELRRIAGEQEASLKALKSEAERLRRIGEAIRANAGLLHQLQTTLKGMLEAGLSWRQVEAEVLKARQDGTPPLNLVLAVNPREKKVKVALEGLEFEVSPVKSIYQEASAYFDEAKRLRSKAASVEKALQETMEKLASIQPPPPSKAELKLERVREKEWYEKFRYSYTSEGLLIVAGRDASSNEALVKRYAKPTDLIFHSEAAGSPFTLLRVEGSASEASLRQAAQFTACYSRAWREGWSAVDVYYIRPEQLSKKAPSGQFLARGSFMVYGDRNYLHGVPLRLALAVRLEGEPRILAMAPEAAEAWASYAVEIAPGRIKARDLAEKAKRKMVELAPKEHRQALLKIPIERLSSLIPYGSGEIVRAFRGRAEKASP